MEVGEQHEPFAETGVLGLDRLLHLQKHLASAPALVERNDPRTCRLVRGIGEGAPFAGTGLDCDVMSALPELTRTRRRERDAVLVGLDLLGDTDLQSGVTLPCARRPPRVCGDTGTARPVSSHPRLRPPSLRSRFWPSGRPRALRRSPDWAHRARGPRRRRGAFARGRSRESCRRPSPPARSRLSGPSPPRALAERRRAVPRPPRACLPATREGLCAPPRAVGERG